MSIGKSNIDTILNSNKVGLSPSDEHKLKYYIERNTSFVNGSNTCMAQETFITAQYSNCMGQETFIPAKDEERIDKTLV